MTKLQLLICFLGGYVLHIANSRKCACATANVNIRNGPGTAYTSLGVLKAPTCLTYDEETVPGSSYTWAKVSYNGQIGWIAVSYLSISTCASADNQCACASTSVSIRDGAGTFNTKLGTLGTGDCLPFFGNEIPSGSYHWSHVNYNGKDAFIAASYLNYETCSGACNTDTVPSGCPTIISRDDWNARSPKNSLTNMASTPGNVYVHHGASQSCTTQSTCAARVRSYQNHHMDTNGWNDIGYSFIVGEDGNVYEGRGWNKVGAHTSGHNSDGYGFCVIGNYTERLPNSAALTALRQLIQCGVNGNHLTPDYVLHGHRDVSSTTCPGQKLYDEIRTWPHYENSIC